MSTKLLNKHSEIKRIIFFKYQKISIEKLLLYILFIFTINNSTFSQKNGFISGKCITKNTNQLSDATLRLYSIDSVFISAVISDSLGQFKFENLELKKYYIHGNHFMEGESNIVIDLQTSFISNDILLEFKLTEIEEIIILYKKPIFEKKVDRMVFNIENTISSIVNNALEAISKTPGVLVLNNNITIVGKSSVNILIDDRMIQMSDDDLINYLKSIPADDISKIEVITNPPARYSAQGNSGLINICLKKIRKKGYRGSVTTNYQQATYDTEGGSFSLNYRKNKLSFLTNGSVSKGATRQTFNNITVYSSQIWNGQSSSKYFLENISGSFNGTYDYSSNTKIGLVYNFGQSSDKYQGETNLSFLQISNQQDSLLSSTINLPNSFISNNVSFYIDKSLDTNGKHLYFEISNLYFTNNKMNDVQNSVFYPNNSFPSNISKMQSTGDQQTNSTTLNLIVDYPLKQYSFSYGTKLTYTYNLLDSKFYDGVSSGYLLNDTNSNKFLYKEGIQAIFADISRTIKKIDLKAGLRGEMIEVEGISSSAETKIMYNYFKLFPTVFINYDINDNHNLNFSYGKRINRPDYTQFNPFRFYSSKYTYSQGNPNLRPSFLNNIELSYSYKYTWFTTVYCSFNQQGFGSIPTFMNGSNVQIYSEENYYNSIKTGITELFVFNKIKYLESINQFSVFYTETETLISQLSPITKGIGSYLYTANTYSFGKINKLAVYLNIFYQLPSVNGIYRMKGFGSLDVGFKMNLLNNKIQFSVGAFDILRTNITNMTIDLNDVTTHANAYFDTRQIRFSLSYSFGNDKVKLEEKEILNKEEKNRTH